MSDTHGRFKMDSSALKRLLSIRTSGSTGGWRWRCPGEERIGAYVDGQLASPAREKVEGHLAGCAPCRSQVGFLLRLERVHSLPAVPASLLARARVPPSGQRHPLAPGLRSAALVGATACALLATTVWLQGPSPTVSPPAPPAPPMTAAGSAPWPSDPAPAVARAVRPSPPSREVRQGKAGPPGPEVLSPREGSVVPGEGLEVRWRGVPGSLFYEVRLVTAEGTNVWEGRTEATAAPLPAGVGLLPGQKYYVWVRAYLSEGKTLKSAATGFRVDRR